MQSDGSQTSISGQAVARHRAADLVESSSRAANTNEPDPASPGRSRIHDARDPRISTAKKTNGVLRQYFPKGSDLSRWTADELDAVTLAINSRPRKALDWKAPAEIFAE